MHKKTASMHDQAAKHRVAMSCGRVAEGNRIMAGLDQLSDHVEPM